MDRRTIAHAGHPFKEKQTSRAYKPLKRNQYVYWPHFVSEDWY